MKIIGFLTRKQYIEASGDFKEGMYIIELEGLNILVPDGLGGDAHVLDIAVGKTVCVDVRVAFKKDEKPKFWAQQITVTG